MFTGVPTLPYSTGTPISSVRFHIPFLTQDTQWVLCSHVMDRIGDHAAVCPCAGDRNRRHNAVTHVCYDAALEGSLHPQKEKPGLLRPPP